MRVRGRLTGHGGCTERACANDAGPRACCNACSGAVALTDGAGPSSRQIALGGADAEAFACRGDDSGLCCDTAIPNGEVVVTGTLRRESSGGESYRIEVQVVCRDP
ncbi:MAG: hypothetical protein R3A52_04505 [Polyangiales bacterium]